MNPRQLGPYRLTRRLGRGGMGTVYEGVNLETGESAAVKVLSVELGHDPDFRNRFASEIETLRRLNHPNIVRLFGFGEQEDELFYAMELVDGVSLEEEIHQGRRFTWREVIQIGSQTCQALRHAHDRGVIHRDIKPANLLWTAETTVKLSDFGIARLFGNTRMTTVGSVIGTVEYMAPEQADAKPVDPRTDLYSLGGVLYALLVGQPPFVAKTLSEMLRKQRHEKPPRVDRLVVGVPEELAILIAQLLEKDPKNRVPNAMLLGRRLDAMAIGLSRRAAEPAPDDDHRPPAADLSPEGFRLTPAVTMPVDPDPIGLAPTRAMDDEDPAPLGESPIGVLPPTESTAVFQSPPLPGPSTTATKVPTSPPADESEAKTIAGSAPAQFNVVVEHELDQMPESNVGRPAVISPQTGILVVALLAIGLTIWYFLRPPSADRLYDRIMAAAEAGDKPSPEDVSQFMIRYGDDSRAKSLRRFEKEIELEDLQRKFNKRVKGLGDEKALLPIERAYLEALNYAWLDPTRGARKMKALIELYGRESDDSGPTGQCLELARRRLAQLEEELNSTTADHLALIENRLDEAEKTRESDPAKAKSMFEAVIELYAEKPWAADAVRRARKDLGE
jgi:eukaryotic-like serine/threonine-protein kinase